jgi:hypothetical protein
MILFSVIKLMKLFFCYRTFSPAIRGSVTTDDRERDEILSQKIQIFRWVKEEHLDIPTAPHNEQFLDFAKKGIKIFLLYFIIVWYIWLTLLYYVIRIIENKLFQGAT